MEINFSKLHGQGNDFIIIDSTARSISLSKTQIQKICHRNFGIGADGLILVKKSNVADFRMDYYNHDGSVAEMCGNGIRCMAKFIYDKGLSNKNVLEIETLAGVKEIFLNMDDSRNIKDIRVDMGAPDFNPRNIPVNLSFSKLVSPDQKSREDNIPESLSVDRSSGDGFVSRFESELSNENSNKKISSCLAVLNYRIYIDSSFFHINCVSMGNPHCVIFIGDDENLSEVLLEKWGPKIETLDIFPNRTNVEFVKVIEYGRDGENCEISMRVWERGVGETLACGTGACAAAVCAIVLGKVSGRKVKVNLPGGSLKVIWEEKNSSSSQASKVFLEGYVEHVFDGVYWL